MATTSQKEPCGADKDATAAGALLMQAALAKAAAFARNGEYAAAEAALAALQDFPAALDLLARVRAQQGRFAIWRGSGALPTCSGALLGITVSRWPV